MPVSLSIRAPYLVLDVSAQLLRVSTAVEARHFLALEEDLITIGSDNKPGIRRQIKIVELLQVEVGRTEIGLMCRSLAHHQIHDVRRDRDCSMSLRDRTRHNIVDLICGGSHDPFSHLELEDLQAA
ncbi:hypothetical protein BDB13_4569 [Rhodococcus sp. OK302]|nr:hypothetical protein BDB13_4569 [Rhodococcus sp. OK302]